MDNNNRNNNNNNDDRRRASGGRGHGRAPYDSRRHQSRQQHPQRYDDDGDDRRRRHGGGGDFSGGVGGQQRGGEQRAGGRHDYNYRGGGRVSGEPHRHRSRSRDSVHYSRAPQQQPRGARRAPCHSQSFWTLMDRRKVEKRGLTLQTNALQVRVKQQPQQQPNDHSMIWHIYRIDIYPVSRRREEQTGNFVLHKIQLPGGDDSDENSNFADPPEFKMIDNTVPTPLTCQICEALRQMEPQLVADGSEIAVSQHDIFEHNQDKDSASTIMSDNNQKEYDICLPRDASVHDPEAEFLGTRWWRVEVERLDKEQLKFHHAMKQVVSDRLPLLERYLTTAVRSACLHMPQLLRSNINKDPLHYLPMPLQFRPDLLGRGLVRPTQTAVQSQPALAIKATASVTQDKSLLVKANVVLDHILPDRTRPDVYPCQNKGRIPLLDPQASTLAGVKVGIGSRLDLDQVIVEPAIREKIANSLKQVRLEVRYERSLTKGGWATKMREEGKTEEWLDKNKWFVRKKRRIYKQVPAEMIEWDPSSYTFDWNGRQITVAAYYKEYYGVQLQYPKMPLIRVSRVERFPCEFLFQSMSASTTDPVLKTDDCLKFCDTFPGQQRLNQIRLVSRESGLFPRDNNDDTGSLQRAFDQLGLEVATTQLKVKAEVLNTPKLKLSRERDSEIEVVDGSWNMRREKFVRGGRLHSFAVIRLSRTGINEPEIRNFFDQLQHVLGTTAMQVSFGMTDHLQNNVVLLDPATASHSDFDNAVDEAQQRCWRSFHAGSTGITLVQHNFGDIEQTATVRECFLRPSPNVPDEVLVLPVDPTKRFLTNSGNWAQLQLPRDAAESEIRNVRWNHEKSQFELRGQPVKALLFRQRDAGIPVGVMRDNEWPCVKKEQISYPTIVFVLCSEKHPSSYYNELKFACEKRGLQSQFVRMDQFKEKHKHGVSPYLCNLVLKLNGKASSPIDRATAWKVPYLEERAGMMILGYTMSSGSGTSGKMVVCSSCMLDHGAMRCGHSAMVQDKATIVASILIERMVKNLFWQWSNHNIGRKVRRVLIYRNGGNDGQFNDIVETEVQAIRKAFRELISSSEPGGMPPITFVISQSNHNMVLALNDEKYSNVPSGTSVREPSVLPRTHPLQTTLDVDSNGINRMDFFLTPQQGLKGTSKPLLYRCLANDASSESPMDRDELLRLTYHLSFQYGTASKAIRDVSLIRYSHRQANRMLSVLERLLDPSSDEPSVLIGQEIDPGSEKCVYGWQRDSNSPLSFDFLDTFGGLDHNGQQQIPFYPNLAM